MQKGSRLVKLLEVFHDRCKTRYCDATCQHDHWRRGHKQICKKIHRGGNAEQYNADKKYKEAVAVAVEACADDIGRPFSR